MAMAAESTWTRAAISGAPTTIFMVDDDCAQCDPALPWTGESRIAEIEMWR
jgi:hypothetical protein